MNAVTKLCGFCGMTQRRVNAVDLNGGMMNRAHTAQLKGRSYAEVTTVDFATGH